MSKTVANVRGPTDEQEHRNQKYEILATCDSQTWQVERWLNTAIA
jgi:hypothetical protein